MTMHQPSVNKFTIFLSTKEGYVYFYFGLILNGIQLKRINKPLDYPSVDKYFIVSIGDRIIHIFISYYIHLQRNFSWLILN